MKTIFKRSLSVIITLCIVLSVVILPSSAASYVANWGQRGTLCTSLTSYANSYYTGSYTYANLSSYSGGTSQSNAPDSSLYSALKSMMTTKHTNINSYNDNKTTAKYTDCQNGDTSKISSFYSGTVLNSSWDGTWNREHTWPNSKGLGGSDEDDLMMIRPTAYAENGSRGNTAYGKSSGYYNPNGESGGALDLRGDVARICLYVYTRWGNTSYMWGSSGVMESLDVLIEWMTADPVDTWEMGKNDAAQSITGVRNVYVDFPELAFQLFGRAVPTGYSSPSLGEGTGTGGSTGGETGGGATDTPTEPEADSTLTISEALTLGTSMTHDTTTTNKYYVTGTVAEISNTTHGNMYITDDSGSRIYVYGTFSADGSTRFDGLETRPYVGDTVTLYGVVGNYNGPQMKNAWITNIVPAEGSENEPTTPQEKTVAEVLAMTTVPRYDVILTGEIVGTYLENWATYGNFYIKDSSTEEQILIYGLYDSTGTTRYENLTTKPVVGDTIKVQAPVSFFNNVAQLKNAKLLSVTLGEGGSSGDNTGGNEGGDNTGDNEGGDGGNTDTPVTPPVNPPADTDGIVFTFGANGTAAHVDGTSATTASFTSGSYTLDISGGTQFYKDGFDAKGNSILKLGSSKNIGSFTFTVPADVVSVVIKAAKYKTNGSVLDVNGTEYTLTKNSNDGEYDEITIDTTTTKTLTVATGSGGKRACIDSIEYVVATNEGCEHIYDDDCDTDCNLCGEEREASHDFGPWTEVTPGNCTTPSVEKRVCSRNEEHYEIRNGSTVADNHTWGAWTEVTPGNCSTPSVEKRVCANDASHFETRNGSTVADNHRYSSDCDKSCNDCGAIRETSVEHTYDDEKDKNCNYCNESRGDGEDTDIPVGENIKGDIDGNGVVDNLDLTYLRRYLARWDVTVVEANLDVDGNGTVDNLDATHLARCLARWDGYTLS